jgi:SAM-dependent methyltransferase
MPQDSTASTTVDAFEPDLVATRRTAAALVDYDRIPIAAQADALGVHAAHELYERLIGLWAPAIIEAAHDLGVFAQLAQAPAGAGDLSRALATDAQATRVLLDALHAYGMVDRVRTENDGYHYELPRHIAECATAAGSLSLVGKFLHDRHRAWPAWQRLADTVRHGAHRSDGGWSENLISAADYQALARGISFWAPPIVELLGAELERLGWGREQARSVLDVGCGAGAYVHLLLRRFPRWRGRGLDVESIVEIAGKGAYEQGVGERFTPLVGDFWTTPWPTNQDLVVFGNIFHLEPRARAQQLAHLAARSVAPGGLVCIIDQIRVGEDERSNPQDRFAVLFAASMLATGGGDTYRLETYDGWLTHAGLERVSLVDAPMHRILLARKRSDS